MQNQRTPESQNPQSGTVQEKLAAIHRKIAESGVDQKIEAECPEIRDFPERLRAHITTRVSEFIKNPVADDTEMQELLDSKLEPLDPDFRELLQKARVMEGERRWVENQKAKKARLKAYDERHFSEEEEKARLRLENTLHEVFQPPPASSNPYKMYGPGFNFDEELKKLKEGVHEEDFTELHEYPTIHPDAFYGITGKIAKAIEPHTEADPAAILLQLLIAEGCSIGHRPYFPVGATRHYTNLFSCLVGRTSRGRKGSALDFVVWVMREVDCPWVGTCLSSGLSSGEGLIYAVRDRLIKKEQIKKNGKYTGEEQEYIADFGVDDKRLLVTEPEFSRPLKAMSRESNILSEVIRRAWDDGTLRTMVKNNPYRAIGAHIAIVGHITREELTKSLLECDFFNGFANRFLWACVQRSKILPFGGSIILGDLAQEISELKAVIEWAHMVEEMDRDDETNELWGSVYKELTSDVPGKFGAAIGRGEGQVLRLSMIFALLDKSIIIQIQHLKAALALWQYCVDSARHLFVKSFDDPHAAKIFEALRRRPEGMTRKQIRIEVFGEHITKSQMDAALGYLRRLSLAYCTTEQTPGRPVERWFAVVRKKENEEPND